MVEGTSRTSSGLLQMQISRSFLELAVVNMFVVKLGM